MQTAAKRIIGETHDLESQRQDRDLPWIVLSIQRVRILEPVGNINEIGVLPPVISTIHPASHGMNISTCMPLVKVGMVYTSLGSPWSRHRRGIQRTRQGLPQSFDTVI